FRRRVPIQIPCRFFRHQLVRKIARDAFRLALLRRADAAAARRVHHQPIARRDLLEALAAHFLAGLEPDVSGRTTMPTVAPARRLVDAVECREDLPTAVDTTADLDDLPMPALRTANAARARAQLLLPEDQRRLALGDLDRRAAHAARISGRRQPILV